MVGSKWKKTPHYTLYENVLFLTNTPLYKQLPTSHTPKYDVLVFWTFLLFASYCRYCSFAYWIGNGCWEWFLHLSNFWRLCCWYCLVGHCFVPMYWSGLGIWKRQVHILGVKCIFVQTIIETFVALTYFYLSSFIFYLTGLPYNYINFVMLQKVYTACSIIGNYIIHLSWQAYHGIDKYWLWDFCWFLVHAIFIYCFKK